MEITTKLQNEEHFMMDDFDKVFVPIWLKKHTRERWGAVRLQSMFYNHFKSYWESMDIQLARWVFGQTVARLRPGVQAFKKRGRWYFLGLVLKTSDGDK